MSADLIHKPWSSGLSSANKCSRPITRWEVRLPNLESRFRGCVLGGAVGDALGAPVEFAKWPLIQAKYGPEGIKDYARGEYGVGAITDDTQMTLFTAEGLIRAWVRQKEKGICGVNGVIHHAYLRWLLTQGERAPLEVGTDGWLFKCPELHARRAPGITCLSALHAATHLGSPTRAVNNSKGCGGIMRMAPLGLFVLEDQIFERACEAAALTHGHPSGYISAGYFAVAIGALRRGSSLEDAMALADRHIADDPEAAEVRQAVHAARTLAARGVPSPLELESLGGAWVGEEALAISLCCALVARDFAHGVRLAVNHGGDSDSPGAITGNILGAMWGVEAIPTHFLDRLELRWELMRIALDMLNITEGRTRSDDIFNDYPGW